MKILSLHIENFGCFSQQDYDFQNGLNSVLEQNGYGKSTLATFIAVMFYGFFDEKGRKKEGGLRDYYKPWQGGTFGGTMDFEYQNKGYRIHRTFGSRPSDDEMRVYDLSTRLETDELAANPGITIFSVDGDSFLRTVFIRDNDCHVELTDGVHAKIGGLGNDTMDMNRFQAADEKLTKMINSLSPTKATGDVKILRKEVAELNAEISAKTGVERAVEERRTDITRLREEKKEKQEQLSTVNQKQEVLAKYQTNLKDRTQYESLCGEAEERRRSFDEATRKFPEEVPEKADLSAARTSYNEFLKYEELKNTNQLTETEKKEKEEASSYFGKSELFSDDESSVKEILTDIQKAKEDLETEKKDKDAIEIAMKQSATAIGQRLLAQKKARIITLIAGVVLIAFSVLGISLQWFTEWKLGPVFAYALLGVGAVLFIIGLILLFTKKKETISEVDLPEYQTYLAKEGRIAELTKDISDGQTKLVDFFDRFGVKYENKDALLLLNQIAQAKKDLARLKEKEGLFGLYADKAATEKGKAAGFVSKYGFSSERPLPDVLSRMESLFDDYEDTKREYLRAAKNLTEFQASHDVTKYIEMTAPSFLETMEELNATANDLNTKISDITEKILAYDREIDDREVKLRDLTEKEEERDEKLAKADELAEKHRLLTIAQSFLTSAKQALTARYQNPVEEHLRAYMDQMTENSGPEFTMDANGALKLKSHGDLKAVESLSHGYRDLAGFALRLSLIDAMYQDEKPPVILDDPFVNLDAEKLEKAKDVVQTLAESYQVLYFTCHESRNI